MSGRVRRDEKVIHLIGKLRDWLPQRISCHRADSSPGFVHPGARVWEKFFGEIRFCYFFYDWTTVDFISRRFKVEDDGNA